MTFKPTLAAFVAACLTAFLGGLVLYGSADLLVGTARSMGPGYFPRLIGYLLLGCAALMLILDRNETWLQADLAPLLSVGAGIFAFAVIFVPFGYLPALFAAIVVSSLGDKAARLHISVLVAIGMAVISWLIFTLLLGLRMPPFRWPL